MKTRRIIWTGAAVLWMGIIFFLSAQTAQESSGLSGRICAALGHLFVPGYDAWDAARQLAFQSSISFWVRKAAHATEYAILAILWSLALKSWGVNSRRTVVFSILISGLYACTDEAHQLFIPGRAGQLRDVAIDTFGATLGAVVFFTVSRARTSRREMTR